MFSLAASAFYTPFYYSFSWWVTQTWLNLGVVAMVEVKWFCFLSRRGRDLKKQHEQRVYEHEMHRITLPLSAFANPTCELVDENTIVITAEPNNQTPTQEPVEGADPLMGTAGTPGAWWRNRMSTWKGVLSHVYAVLQNLRGPNPMSTFPLPVVSFLFTLPLQHGFTVKVGHMPWESGGMLLSFLVPDSVLISSTTLLGKVGHVGIHWKRWNGGLE